MLVTTTDGLEAPFVDPGEGRAREDSMSEDGVEFRGPGFSAACQMSATRIPSQSSTSTHPVFHSEMFSLIQLSKLSTWMTKKPWICETCRSTVMTWSVSLVREAMFVAGQPGKELFEIFPRPECSG